MAKVKTEQKTETHIKPPLNWLLLFGRRRLMLTPWKYSIPCLKVFEQFKK